MTDEFDADYLDRLIRGSIIASLDTAQKAGFTPEADHDHMTIYLQDFLRVIEEFELPGKDEIEGALNITSSNNRPKATIAKKVIQSWKITIEKLQYLQKNIENNEIIILNNDWKNRIQTYLAHIRDAVRGADIDEGIRERIFKKIEELGREVERNRTLLSKYSELWLETTRVTGEGAKNLKPAIELLRRLTGAVQSANENAVEVRQLPAPDLASLPDPTDLDE